MAASSRLTVQIKLAWWVLPYLHTVSWFCWLTGIEPDIDKLVAVALHGVSLKPELKAKG